MKMFARGFFGFFEIDIDKMVTGNCFSGRLRAARKFATAADVNIVLIRAAKSTR